MQYTATSQEIFETFCISKNHKKHLKIDENNKTIYFNYPEKEVEINYEPVNILYEDAFLIAAFKPPFLLVHDDGNSQDTLQARINGYLQLNGNKYPAQAIHRIDYETSGLVLFCKHPFFQAYCDKNMEEHHIKKEFKVTRIIKTKRLFQISQEIVIMPRKCSSIQMEKKVFQYLTHLKTIKIIR